MGNPLCEKCRQPVPEGLPGRFCAACLLTPALDWWKAFEAEQSAPPTPNRSDSAPSIAGYRLIRTLGEGAFGVVWLAAQTDPVRREVALKILKPGVASSEALARFESERQALALMEHENIARVFDAGSTEAGVPYFVMELVRGEPITDFCDSHALGLEERVALFLQVCRGVRHAHQKGVIHRDLKPSNVLVMPSPAGPVAKVIDFGVARALEQTLTERTLFTLHGQIVGTPQYMSPEQAEGTGDVDTRSDAYSLGVLLYELLTGATPLAAESLRRVGYAEILRQLRETDPPAPSRRVSTLGAEISSVAARRKIDPASLPRALRGDLDWIAMKALEKDRNRRLASAEALEEDLSRMLRHEPVQSRPPSLSYRLGRTVRRHRAATVAVLGVTVSVIGALVVSLRQYRLADAARAEALRQLRESERLRGAEHQARLTAEKSAGSIVDLLSASSPWKSDRSSYATTLDGTLDQLEADTGVDTTIALRVLDSLYQANAELDRRKACLRVAALGGRIAEERMPPSARRNDALFTAAFRFRSHGSAADSIRLLDLVENDLKAGHGVIKGAFNRLWLARAWLAPWMSDDDARKAAETAWQTAQQECEDNRFNYLLSMERFAISRAIDGHLDEAGALLQRAWTECQEVGSPSIVANISGDLAALARHRNQANAALDWLARGHESLRRFNEWVDISHVDAVSRHADELLAQGKVDDAVELLQEHDRHLLEAVGETEPAVFIAELAHATLFLRANRPDDALERALRAEKRTRSNFGPLNANTLRSAALVAQCWIRKGDGAAASRVLDASEPALTMPDAGPSGEVALRLARAEYLTTFGQPGQAEAAALEAAARADEAFGAPTHAAPVTKMRAATLVAQAGNPAKARGMLALVRTGFSRILIPGHPSFSALARAEKKLDAPQ